MMIHPFDHFGHTEPIAVTARQWQAAKMRATNSNSNKNRPGNRYSRIKAVRKLFAAYLQKFMKDVPGC